MTSNSLTTLHFVRHGLVHNPTQVFYGRLPRFGLGSEGLRQAQALAPFFAGRVIHSITSSPLLRARQTAGVIASFMAPMPVRTSAYLLECHTPYDGRPLSELDARDWDLYTGSPAPYEQPIDVFKRAFMFIRRALKANPGRQMVAVTHADVIVFLSLWANGYAVNFENKSLIEHKQIPILFPAPASVTSFTWQDGQDMPAFEYHNPQQR